MFHFISNLSLEWSSLRQKLTVIFSMIPFHSQIIHNHVVLTIVINSQTYHVQLIMKNNDLQVLVLEVFTLFHFVPIWNSRNVGLYSTVQPNTVQYSTVLSKALSSIWHSGESFVLHCTAWRVLFCTKMYCLTIGDHYEACHLNLSSINHCWLASPLQCSSLGASARGPVDRHRAVFTCLILLSILL